MKLRLVACLFVWLALSAVAAFGQQNPLRGPEQQPPPAEPDQPVRPLTPILRPRRAAERRAARRTISAGAGEPAASAAAAAAVPAHPAGRRPG